MHIATKPRRLKGNSNNQSVNKTHFEVLCDFESLWHEEDQGHNRD
jgi:hypothetical protein